MIFTAKFEELEANMSASFEANIVVEVTNDYKIYEGNYEVTPSLESQTLPTKHKVMASDLTVEAVPVFETSNNSGGTTVYIAKE